MDRSRHACATFRSTFAVGFGRLSSNRPERREAARRPIYLRGDRVATGAQGAPRRASRPCQTRTSAGTGKLVHRRLPLELIEQNPEITLRELQGALGEAECPRRRETPPARALRRLGRRTKTYGPPRLQADFFDPAVSVCANVSGIGALLPAQMELRATRSSQNSRRHGAIF